MTRYVDGAGRPLQLGEELGRGGEGAVFGVADPKFCAKVYHKPLSGDRADKIRVMSRMASDQLASLTSWPKDLVSNDRGEPVGLVMPRIVGRKDVHKLYSPKSRRSEFLRADWRFLIRAAANTARAFGAVHDVGCVIGDVNHGSVLVAQDATVSLIDCDSFQVVAEGRRFLCEVGVETYTPPELQGRSFAGVIRTSNHDAFGLAVMVFHLLMMGRHPFAGRFLGAGDMPISKAIEEFRFAYGARRAEFQMERPPGAPPLEIVGGLASLFERSFSQATTAHGRPTAREWMGSLEALEKDVRQCRSNQAHWHLSSLSACPWCQMEGATGTILFPLVLQQASAMAALDVEALWQQVGALGHPGPIPAIPHPQLRPSPPALELKGHEGKRNAVAALVAGVLFVALIALRLGPLPFVAAGIGFFVTRSLMDRSQEVGRYKAALEVATRDWRSSLDNWNRNADPSPFEARLASVGSKYQEWKQIPTLRLKKLDQLRTDQRRLQLERFLDQFEIDKARIPGIGAGRKSALVSEGIETAADVKPGRLHIPGFGPATQAKLLAWRASLEGKFVFDASKAVDARDIARVEQEVLAERRRIEDALRAGYAELQQSKAQILAVRQNMRRQVEAATAAFVQATVDLQTLR